MPLAFILFSSAVLGLCLGSFLNVVILRDDERMSILAGRSRCPQCRHALAGYDLVPLLSFVWLAGRCRYCRKPISWQYPAVEAVAAGLAALSAWYGYWERGNWLLAVFLFLALAVFLVVSVIDIRTLEIPMEYVAAAALFGAISFLIAQPSAWLNLVLGMAAGAGSIAFVLYGWLLLFKEQGMGSGDIWVAAAVGATVGYPSVWVALMASVMIGALVGLALLVFHKKGMHSSLPFGPFLATGLLVALVWGPALISWYTI